MKRPRVLVTGASSAIGTEIVAGLSPTMDVVATVHRVSDFVRNDGTPLPPDAVEAILADISEPRLGLARGDYNQLRSSLDLIVHSAAITDFGRPDEAYEKVNLGGTSNVLELADRSPADKIPILHVSTAYVCGDRVGVVFEQDLAAGQRFANAYERTKFEAELLVHEQMAAGQPAVILRPSIVVGTAKMGITRTFKNVYILIKILTEGRVRAIPASYEATLDLVPIDYVAAAVVEAANRFSALEGETLHLTGKAPVSPREVSDVLAEYPSLAMPRFVPAPSFDRDSLPSIERRYYERVVSLYEPYFQCRMRFSTERTEHLLGVRPLCGGKPFLRRLLDHCLDVEYLGAPLPGIEAALAGVQQRTSSAPGPAVSKAVA